jgi:hypothetical protein
MLDPATAAAIRGKYATWVTASRRYDKTPIPANIGYVHAATTDAWKAVRANDAAWATLSSSSAKDEVVSAVVKDLGVAADYMQTAKRMRTKADVMDNAAKRIMTSARAELMGVEVGGYVFLVCSSFKHHLTPMYNSSFIPGASPAFSAFSAFPGGTSFRGRRSF